MRATDGFSQSNVAAGDYGDGAYGLKALAGGLYELASVATWGGGSHQMQQLGPDASTWLNVGSAVSANGVTTAYLPPGLYRVVITTSTANYFAVSRIPIE